MTLPSMMSLFGLHDLRSSSTGMRLTNHYSFQSQPLRVACLVFRMDFSPNGRVSLFLYPRNFGAFGLVLRDLNVIGTGVHIWRTVAHRAGVLVGP